MLQVPVGCDSAENAAFTDVTRFPQIQEHVSVYFYPSVYQLVSKMVTAYSICAQ